ncbi:MAG: hypothetical protein WCY60_05980 [Trueperaceae bacterium]|jgi:hypothetical protein
MNERTSLNIARLLLASLTALVLSAAFAQELDPRGVALLEALVDDSRPDTVNNMDMAFTSVTYMEGEEYASRTRTVIDYENQRAAIISEVMGMETRMIMVDGQARMSMMGMTMPLPPGTEGQFDSIFEEQTGENLIDAAARITFDGAVNYGDLLVGDQVTYEGDAGVYGTPDATVIHYVFNSSGALLGMHMPTDSGDMLMVYKEPLTGSIMSYDMSMYIQDGASWTLMQDMTLEHMEYNTELDESLFL